MAEKNRIEKKIKIMHTTDIHGALFSHDFIENGPARGALSRVYAFVCREREKHPNTSVLLDCGDVLQGQPTAYYYNFVDTRSPHLIAEVMNHMKYDALCIGNHDLDYNGRSDYRSDSTFCSHFGPSHYSFNVGKIHYVVLKDVFYYGDRFLYIGYLDEAQLGWLEQDLAGVQKGSTVILAMHIPAVYGDSAEGQTVAVMRNSLQNRDALFRILDGYQVHIMAGHSHTQWNTVVSDNIMEHVHVAASGAWWQGSLGRDGTPAGYTVYRMCGDDISWYYKGAGMEADEQFRLYLDSDTVAANVFNYDPDWKVEVCEDGIPAGEMEQYWGADPEAMRLYPAGQNKTYPWLSYGQTHHLFRWRIKNGTDGLTVRVTDRFGNVYEKRLRMPQ